MKRIICSFIYYFFPLIFDSLNSVYTERSCLKYRQLPPCLPFYFFYHSSQLFIIVHTVKRYFLHRFYIESPLVFFHETVLYALFACRPRKKIEIAPINQPLYSKDYAEFHWKNDRKVLKCSYRNWEKAKLYPRLAHRKLSNSYSPLDAKHQATDPLHANWMYVLHLGGIAFSRISARKKGSIFIPFLRLSQLQPILPLYSSIKRNESTITSFKLYNFSKKKKETKGMPEPMTDVFVSDLRSVERRRGKGGTTDGDTWRTCPSDKICSIQADRFSQRASITCTPNSSTCWWLRSRDRGLDRV